MADEQTVGRRLHKQLTSELKALDTQEHNLINLAADDALPKAKINSKIRDIERQRRHLTERLTETNEDISDSARLIEVGLKLLENPQEPYRRCDDEQRRLLNQAIFQALYIEDGQVTDHDLKQPFARLHDIQRAQQPTHSDKPHPPAPQPQNANRAVPNRGSDPASSDGVEALLQGIDVTTSRSDKPKAPRRTAYNTKAKLRALKSLIRKLPSLDAPLKPTPSQRRAI